MLARKKHPQIKLQRLEKVCAETFQLLILKQKRKVVTGKIPSFVIVSFCTPHSICLNIWLLAGQFYIEVLGFHSFFN